MPRISRRPKLSFTQKDLDYLIKLSHSRNQAASIVERSKIILLSYHGKNDTEISRELKVDYKTVRKWIKRVLDLGVKEGLIDKSRSGRPQNISAESRAFVISLACMKPKNIGYPHEIWTQRLLAKHIRKNCIKEGHSDLSSINQGTISKILNASNIKPHKIRFYIAKVDPEFDQKAAKVLATYNEANELRENIKKEEIESVIISYDEKPGIQAIGNVYPDLMPVEGHYSTIARDYEYRRHGTLSLLSGIDLISGRIIYKVFEKHRSWEFIQFLKELELIYPKEKIKILMDNHKIHTSIETREYLKTVPDKFEFVFTPKHASWLNIIESFFSKMARSVLRGIRVDSIKELGERISQYIDQINEKPVIFKWKYKMEERVEMPGGIII